MTLHTQIIEKLRHLSHNELLKTMGYHNLKAGHKTLKQFLDTADIYLWLKNGNYDLKYNSEQFLKQLLKALNLTSAGNDVLKQYNKRLDAISAMRNTPYIYIDTHFKRASQPIFALAFMESKRNIRLDKEQLLFKSEKETLKIVGDIVKKHYLSSNGKLQLWGEIFTYIYHNTDGKKFVFNPDGTLSINQGEIMESRAELRIGNQKINFIE